MLSDPNSRSRCDIAQAVAWLIAGLVLVQAGLAGRFLNGDGDLVGVHRVLAEGVAPVAVVLAWAAFTVRPAHRSLRVGSAVVLALVVVQTGLGFAGRDSTEVASLHVPVGVALFGLAVVVAMTARSGPRAP